ncbi:putative translation initiation factor eif-2b subunit family protein [Phaeoacremonium minimum UCRPA7]|uniref:Putative translation initiation factor eif-2b subunit family protein n=1 Tax=Phaeoacremonium minimum (strain UCR-PA7) TaxID=1286976 RepID=R8BD29_PHAM7|nr:putative translation initiation factor eif-2b subunit family protein [Phaeoacremonium minimum UCRPA7]EON97214.1 putative translation initiation factor eif-2b subunit family protein [Phaeoacremonium minimum UCRPA7]
MATEKPPLKKRSVVSSFIYKYVDENGERKPKVALFRRSDKVNTYQHRLAVISGSIEKTDPSPLVAAWRELQEETTLTAQSLELLREGKPYVLPDEDIGREWTIYPFAFRLKDPEEGGKGEGGITIDWEHESWGWYDPFEVVDSDEFGGVPKLAESLRRVWFEKDLGEAAGKLLAEGLDKLKHDHQSGARQLAGVALQTLRDIIATLDSPEPSDEWWAKVRFAAWHIWKNGRESMGAAIMNALVSALKSTEETLRQHKEHPASAHSMKWRDAVLGDLERRISLRGTDSVRIISESFAKYLSDGFAPEEGAGRLIRILTLSESSTIIACLKHAVLHTNACFDLRVLESRPLFEGVSLVGTLTNELLATQATLHEAEADPNAPPKLKITLFTDASAALASVDVDIVLIGADRIAASGAVSNKTGSLPAVLSAKHISPKSKTVVIGESEKVAPPGNPADHVVEDNDPVQLLRAWKSEYNSDRVRHTAGTIARVVGSEVGGEATSGGFDGTKVAVSNVFFEWVGPELVDVYVTEFGLWTVKDIERHSGTLGSEVDRLFKDI